MISWLKGLFGGRSDGSLSLVSLSDREYEQLFDQVLRGVTANWEWSVNVHGFGQSITVLNGSKNL